MRTFERLTTDDGIVVVLFVILRALSFVVALIVATGLVARGAVGPPSNFAAVRADRAMLTDPALSDPGWRAGALPPPDQYMNLTRRERSAAATRAYLLYDDTNLYVAFRCEQPNAPIVATQTTNDLGFGLDDFVGIGIDTSGNGSQVYFFETTPHGTRYQQASESNRYRPVWSAVGTIDGTAWNAVMTIPLSALRFATGTTLTWRVNVVRSVSALNEHFTWAFDPIMQDAPAGNGWPAIADARFWPRLTGLHVRASEHARIPSADLYALGAAGGDRHRFVAPDGSLEREASRSVGLDVTYPLTNTTTLVATAAPDFSNVEVDQQTIAPQEFARQLKEYRPFFAQGAGYIETNPYPPGSYVSPGDLIFYTPNVGPFDRGAKVEGTLGNQSFGAMSFRGYDSVRQAVFDDIAYGYKHALPDRTFLYWADGVLAHHSDLGSDATTEYGVGGRNNRTGFVWQIDDALERGTQPGSRNDHSANAFVDVHKPNYEANVSYRDVSAGYHPLDGFTATADLRGFGESLNVGGPALNAKNVQLQLYADRYLDRSGAVHEADTYAYLSATFKNGLSIDTLGPGTGMLRSYELPANADCSGPAIARSAYTGGPCYRNGVTDRFNLFNAALGYREGTSTPATFSYAFGPFGAAYVHEFSFVTSRPLGARFSVGIEYDGTDQRSFATGALDSQWLRRVSLGTTLGADENVTLGLRSINGFGGYALPGVNVSAAYHKRYRNGNDLYLNFGTPAATQTLDRLIVKYVLHVGPLRS